MTAELLARAGRITRRELERTERAVLAEVASWHRAKTRPQWLLGQTQADQVRMCEIELEKACDAHSRQLARWLRLADARAEADRRERERFSARQEAI